MNFEQAVRSKGASLRYCVRVESEDGASKVASFFVTFPSEIMGIKGIAIFSKWEDDHLDFSNQLWENGIGTTIIEDNVLSGISIEGAQQLLADWGL